MPDPFDNHAIGLESPATLLVPVTPNDGTDLTMPSRAINVAQSGSVRITTTGGSTATVYIAAGIGFPVRATRIWATGTTATDIVVML
ncbi:hypothetical protein KUL25_21605 [Rhodobacteraceae bacterium N5(2021)]|uniref:Uncharacterized protein n=1 Tax=Gymnodinialimonas phycosphaerae TaxID=2841589 RepID=A0A975TZ56_9RHOB|nr:hypothetical protein [Gymnodinialimonas phycosphaerae]MBY4895366.1 hypothetical protein [Gymnodinialimonas phycosphaerae]